MTARKALLGTALIFVVSQARADTFDWAYNITVDGAGPDHQQLIVDASGVLTTTNTEVNGALLVTGITGSRTTNYYMGTFLNPSQTAQIVGLVPPGVISPNPPDNLIYPHTSAVLDYLGIGYQLNCDYCGSRGVGGIVQVAGPGPYELGGAGLSGGTFSSFTLSPAPVPEPASITLFSLAGFAALLYRWRVAWKGRTGRTSSV